MGRAFLAAVFGFAAAILVIFVLEWVGHLIFPPPAGLDLDDPVALADYISNAPVAPLLAVLVAYFVGAIAGGYVATKMSRPRPLAAILVGLMLILAGIVNLVTLPHPLWFAVASTLIYLPAAHLGFRLAAERRRA